MSTYYKLICEKHKERTDASSRTLGGWCFLGDGGETLVPFLIAHCGCNIRSVSEHEDESYDETYRDWTRESVEEEVHKAQLDFRWR